MSSHGAIPGSQPEERFADARDAHVELASSGDSRWHPQDEAIAGRAGGGHLFVRGPT